MADIGTKSRQPSTVPTGREPTSGRSSGPTGEPTTDLSSGSTNEPTSRPSSGPTDEPPSEPSNGPTGKPSNGPTDVPTGEPTSRPANGPTVEPSNEPSSGPTGTPSNGPTDGPTSEPSSGPSSDPTNGPTIPVDYKNGFLNSGDVCKIEEDGMCPCYPQDDDWYCSHSYYGSFPWDLSARVNNMDSDVEYERCDESKLPRCGPHEKLCPMRKPRLDRWYGDDRKDLYYYIDYDCIQCVPRNENCSKCSPGVWCHAINRCVAPGPPSRWCRQTWSSNPNQEQ